MKNNKKLIAIFLLIFSALLITSCSGRTFDASGWPNVSIQDGTAYISFQAHVYAVDISSGQEQWRYPAEPDGGTNFYAAPAIVNEELLVVGDYAGTLHGLNMNSGQVLWTFDGGGRYIASPYAINDTIYAPSSDQQVYAVSDSGILQWDNFRTEEPLWATPNTSADCDCVYIGGMDHILYALDASSGSVIWQTEPLGGSIVGQPLVVDSGDILVGTFANELVSVSDNGNVNWRFPTEDWVWTSPSINGENVIVGDLSGTLYSVNVDTGVSDWQLQPGGPIIGDPWVTENGEVIFGTEDGELVMVNASGTVQWNQATDYTFYSGPIQTEDLFLITSNQPDAVLIAYNLNGAPRWVFSPEN